MSATHIVLEVSSAAGRPPFGGIPSLIRRQVEALLAVDPNTRYSLRYKFSRWRKGDLFRPQQGHAPTPIVVGPLGTWVARDASLIHFMSGFVARAGSALKLATIYDLTHLRYPEWVSDHHRERRQRQLEDMVRAADHIVTTSEFTAGDVCDAFRIGRDRVHSVLAGVDLSTFHPLPPSEIAAVRATYGDYVLAIGLLTPRKNFIALVEAMRALPDLRLVLVGNSSHGSRAFFDAVERCRLRDRVLHLQGVPQQELVRLINGARVFAAPSLHEGFGLVVLEALACGVPIAAYPVTGPKDVVIHGKVGHLSDDLREAAMQALTMDRAICREYACGFSWEASAHQFVNNIAAARAQLS